MTIRIDLVHKDGALFTPVSLQIPLTVSVQIQAAGPTPAMYWVFPDPGVYGSTLPLDVARQTDVY
jgi:hypothetical protein